MEVLGVTQVYRVLASITKPTGPYLKRVQTLCDGLLELGFHSVRYYEAVYDRFEEEQTQFILTNAAYQRGETESLIGLKIPYSNTTLVTSSESSDGLARGRNDQATDAQKSAWIQRLRIDKTNWIDLEIKSKGEVVGLLALSWTGSYDLVDRAGETALRIIRGTLGNLYTASLGTEGAFQEGKDKLAKAINGLNKSPQRTVAEITKLVCDLIECDVVAAFQYDWVTNRVKKVTEFQNEKVPDFDVLEEDYALDRMITGKAFIDQNFRFIPDFQVFLDKSDVHVDTISLKYHIEKIGNIRSILYMMLGTQSNRVLLRAFRADARNLPGFTYRDLSIGKLIQEITTAGLDEIELRRRKDVIRSAAIDGLKGFSDPDQLMDLLKRELAHLGAQSFISVHYSRSGETTDYVTATSDIKDPRKFFAGAASEAWSAVKSLPTRETVSELGPNGLDALGLGVFLSGIRAMAKDSIGIFCLETSDLITQLIIPMNGVGARSRYPFDHRLSEDELAHVLSLLSIFGASLEAKTSHISAENADDLLANIGHELQTPITEIEQAAISAIELCHEFLDEIERNSSLNGEDIGSARVELEAEITAVNKKADLLRHFMDIPRTMSEFFGGDSMPITFQQSNWGDLVDESWNLAFTWAHEISEYYEELGRASFGSVILRKNQAINKMACVLCEPLVKMALANLLKNAIKFSLPRYQGQPMVVEVLAIPQNGWNIIQVKNWGIGIEPHHFEEIFRKYYRVDRLDAKRDIAGRGLGLYLSRAMIRAQGGNLFCESSVSTLDDPEKRKTLTGYQTTFELRIPTNNNPGSRKVKLK